MLYCTVVVLLCQPENLIYLSPDPDSPIKITDFGPLLHEHPTRRFCIWHLQVLSSGSD